MAKRKNSVTSLDVARVAGVSQSTVSMILNNSDYGSFTEETRQKVYQACFGIIDAIQRKKKRIPQDYSVCGCDNTSLSNIKSLSLTTVDNYTSHRASEAVNILIKKIKNANNPVQEQSPISTVKVEYTPKLVLRSSTGPARKI